MPRQRRTPPKVESGIFPLDDGCLYLAYTVGERSDYVEGEMPEGAIKIMGKWSGDQGESWSEPFLVREYSGVLNAMEPSFVRFPSGRVLQTYMRRDTLCTWR